MASPTFTDTRQSDDARAQVHNQYGAALAAKASNLFCLALTSPPAVRTFAEAAIAPTASTKAPRVVVEFTEESATVAANRPMLDNKHWKQLKKALQGVKDALEIPQVSPEASHWQALQLLRQTVIIATREKFFKSANLVTEHLERSLSRLYALSTQSLANEQNLTRICWLNQSVQTLSDPRALAEVAADPRIRFIDLPRRLKADVNETGAIVGNAAYRSHFPRSGKGIIVAVIDSEVALSHPAMRGRVVHRRNYTQEPWGNPDSHGTAVAGIIAGQDATYSGMAPDATIYNYKVLATNPDLNASDFEGALAIQQALEDGVHIANCSWGVGPITGRKSREARACDEAWALGMTIVKSAGNAGPLPGTMTSPADATGIIVVGATNKLGNEVPDYSSRGSQDPAGPHPHLLAPGGTPDIGMKSCLTNGGFGSCGYGTSYAAPHVSGMLALLLEADPDLTPDEQRAQMIQICKSLPEVENFAQGAGLPSMLTLVPS